MAVTLEDIKELSPKKKAIIGVLICVIIGVLYYIYFLQPALEKLQAMSQDLAATNQKIAEAEKTVRLIETHKKEIARLNEDLSAALAKLPDRKEIPLLLAQVSQAGTDRGLDFILFEPAPTVVKDFYAEIPVNVILAGAYSNVLGFFEYVAKLPRIINMTNINMQKAKEQTGDVTVLITKSILKTYMFVERANEEKKTQ